LKADLQNEQGVIRVTDENNPTGVQPKITSGRNVKDLPELIEDYEEQVRALESVLAKYLKNPDRLPAKRPTMKPSSKSKYSGPGNNGKVDSIEYLTERIRELEVEIIQVRESVDKRNPMPYAFASWDHIAQAHSVAFANRNKNPLGARLDLAPRPTDIIWKNLSVGRSSRKSRRFVNAIWISVLTIIWLPLNAAISIFLSNLGNLGALWDDFQSSLERNPIWWGIVQAVLAPTIISLVYMVLPIIFRRLQIRAGDTTKTEREQHVVRNLYTFFVLNNLILFSIFSAVWQYVSTIISSSRNDNTSAWDAITDGQFFLRTMRALCDISAFWVTFLLQRNLGAALDLVQLTRIFVTWFQRKFMSPTPRQNIEWTAPVPFDYASYYNYYLFYATIAAAFANLQPLILLIAGVFFVVESIMKKYLMLYVFVTKNETGGQLWRTLFNRMIFAALLSDVVVAIVLVAKNQWIKTGTLAPLLFFLLGFKFYCMKTFDKEIKYYATSGLVDQESLQSDSKQRRQAEKVAVKFGHPALYKPLMTPMVHAKAQHILADVYHGRLNSDAAPLAHGFSDNYAMQPVGGAGGKTDATAPAPFEFVSEAQQDFAFYKNREDFREDGGNIYGHPEDTMTESRSATPMGFKPGHAAHISEASGESSRANSPAPLRRKELGNQAQVHPTFRNGYGMDSQSSLNRMDTADSRDLGLGPRAGLYTDPDDDRTNLLNTNVSMAQFRSGYTPGGTPTPGQEGGYDYFRKN
jgi:calcium permeable stress-gated cation channel